MARVWRSDKSGSAGLDGDEALISPSTDAKRAVRWQIKNEKLCDSSAYLYKYLWTCFFLGHLDFSWVVWVKELLGPIQGLKNPTHLSNPWLSQTKKREGKVMGFSDTFFSAPFQRRTGAPQLLIHRYSEMLWCLFGIWWSQRLLWIFQIYSLWHKGSYQNAIR